MVEVTYISAKTGATWIVSEPDPESPPLTLEDYRRAVQAHIDTTAHNRSYDSGVSMASYVASTNAQWAAEAAAFVAWRDAVWTLVYAIWEAPPDPLPTPAAVVADLPEIVWPDLT